MKGIACVCMLLGCGGFGLFKVYEYHKRYEELVYIRYIIHSMLIQIENHRGTFGETCLALSGKVKKPYAGMFEKLYQLLEIERKDSPQNYWDKMVDELAREIKLTKEEISILQGMIRCADCNTLSMPLVVLRQTISEWDKVILKAEQIRNERSRVALALSVSTGLIACITIL